MLPKFIHGYCNIRFEIRSSFLVPITQQFLKYTILISLWYNEKKKLINQMYCNNSSTISKKHLLLIIIIYTLLGDSNNSNDSNNNNLYIL